MVAVSTRLTTRSHGSVDRKKDNKKWKKSKLTRAFAFRACRFVDASRAIFHAPHSRSRHARVTPGASVDCHPAPAMPRRQSLPSAFATRSMYLSPRLMTWSVHCSRSPASHGSSDNAHRARPDIRQPTEFRNPALGCGIIQSPDPPTAWRITPSPQQNR